MRWEAETRAALERVKQKILEQYGDDPNITGVGIGMRQRAGELVDEPVVGVAVVKKRPAALVSRHRLLPGTVDIDGGEWGVDVIETGPFQAYATLSPAPRTEPAAPAQPAQPITERMRPPRQGCSISNLVAGQTAGTYGANVRDLTDGTVCVLSSNHVLARRKQAAADEAVIQPGGSDDPPPRPGNRIAGVKRFDPIHPDTGTDTDAAIAQLDDQNGHTDLVARGLMTPISPDHPAVGLLVGGSAAGATLLTDIDTVLDRLDVELLAATGGSTATTGAVPGMHVEKVGRTSGYTSSIVQLTNFGPVNVDLGPPLGVVPYRDLVLVHRLGSPGDSGAVVCQGGDGTTLVPLPPCQVLGTVGDYYELPLRGDEELADDLRDEFLGQSLTGQLLTTAIYANSQVVVDRLDGALPYPDEIVYAQELYAKYRDFVATVLADPSSTEVVTEDHLSDVYFIVWGLHQTVLTPEESEAAGILVDEVLANTVGMNRRQVVAYMNDPAVAQRVYDTLRQVPTINLTGPVELLD